MKNKILKLIFFLLTTIIGCDLYSQELESVIHFDGRYNKSDNAVVTYLKGKKIKDYRLSLFHSITLTQATEDIILFNTTVLNDKKHAVKIEEIYSQNKLRACYMQFDPINENSTLNRFILYKADQENAILIYMEGDTTLEQLIKIFINKN